MSRKLLCTDLDRTLIPNGREPESPRARERFNRLANRPELTLVYVTGRHRELIQEAITQYDLPQPAYAISDVGTNIYSITSSGWHALPEWQAQLMRIWPQAGREQLQAELGKIPELILQEPEKQNRFKLSYYTDVAIDADELVDQVRVCAAGCGLPVNIVCSVDESTGRGLLDVLPAGAGKLTATRHLMRCLKFDLQDTLFAGDSGNDVDVFSSEIPSIIVANADKEIKQWAKQCPAGQIYIAKGSSDEWNGNYSAGIVEGACHFWPEVVRWIDDG